MFETPLVSIIVPIFNGANVVSETLESIRAQTFKDFEVIVVDDGSTDDGPAIVRFREADSRFKLVSQANAGLPIAHNNAILQARGEWIALLDHDDVWFPQKLERQLALSREDPRANFCSRIFIFGMAGAICASCILMARRLRRRRHHPPVDF